MKSIENTNCVAIVGMAGRFPGAPTLTHFWQNLTAGIESISRFPPGDTWGSAYVPAKGIVDDIEGFDIETFDFTREEATIMDPQFRVLLEVALASLEDSGYDPNQFPGRIGVFAGTGANTYQEVLRSHPEALDRVGLLRAAMLNDRDFLSAWISFKLNLTGPAVTVQTACSTSLVAVHLASQSLLNGESDIALAGGVSLLLPQRSGYTYAEGGMFSPDGHCRPFDRQANGFVPAEGAGIVVLRRLADAWRDGDSIRAVIMGSTVNNDGANKIGFTAPSHTGIASAAAESIAMAGVNCDSIGYVEAHGTATPLGDPIEVAALTEVFRRHTSRKQFCAIGSVKSNIGHANAAAGIASLIKTVLVLQHGVIPATLNCTEPNPDIRFEDTPFYVPRESREWAAEGRRRACVNAFGIGGTNAHIVLEDFAPPVSSATAGCEVLLLSANTESALGRLCQNLADHIENSAELSLADAGFTLSAGRRERKRRKAIVCENANDAVRTLRSEEYSGSECPDRSEPPRPVFVFGTDGFHNNLGVDLYRDESVFRGHVDECAQVLMSFGLPDPRTVLYPGAEGGRGPAFDPSLCMVVTGYAAARQLMSWGVGPEAVMGVGAGEYIAACIAGVISLEAALARAANCGARTKIVPSSGAVKADGPSFFLSGIGARIRGCDGLDAARLQSVPPDDVRLAAELRTLLRGSGYVLVEFGSNAVIRSTVESAGARRGQWLRALPSPGETVPGRRQLLQTPGSLWAEGAAVDWSAFRGSRRLRRIPLPTYPFERKQCWVYDNGTAGKLVTAERLFTLTGSVNNRGHAGVHRATGALPESDLEVVVASIWAAYLGGQTIGVRENFFELGGNSILATRITSELRETLQIDLPLRVILEHPTVSGMVAAIDDFSQRAGTNVNEVARLVRGIASISDGGAAELARVSD